MTERSYETNIAGFSGNVDPGARKSDFSSDTSKRFPPDADKDIEIEDTAETTQKSVSLNNNNNSTSVRTTDDNNESGRKPSRDHGPENSAQVHEACIQDQPEQTRNGVGNCCKGTTTWVHAQCHDDVKLEAGEVSFPQSYSGSVESPGGSVEINGFSARQKTDPGVQITRAIPTSPDIARKCGLPSIAPQESQILQLPLYMGLRRGNLRFQSRSAPTAPQAARRKMSLKESSFSPNRLIDLKVEVSMERRKSLPWNEYRTIQRPEVLSAHAQPEVRNTSARIRRKSFDIWLNEKEEDNMRKRLQELAAKRAEEQAREGQLRKKSGKTYEEWLQDKSKTDSLKETTEVRNDRGSLKTSPLKFEEWMRRKDQEALEREERARREAEQKYEEKRKRREEVLRAARTFRKLHRKVSTQA
ncbi:predicted protein [Nematostella vectensis]|uniref:Uncharacterized protein n=1 Tax=Nematostella vectensis TaxID=45351 RepID=A7RRJ2_NEMVE|nr:predicted protein [Nematostella vectensis]|eukprot:XP_001638026.1 predicted protein [Nematostella vectensis]